MTARVLASRPAHTAKSSLGTKASYGPVWASPEAKARPPYKNCVRDSSYLPMTRPRKRRGPEPPWCFSGEVPGQGSSLNLEGPTQNMMSTQILGTNQSPLTAYMSSNVGAFHCVTRVQVPWKTRHGKLVRSEFSCQETYQPPLNCMAVRTSKGTVTLKHAANRQTPVLKYAKLAHALPSTTLMSPEHRCHLVNINPRFRPITRSLLKLQVL